MLVAVQPAKQNFLPVQPMAITFKPVGRDLRVKFQNPVDAVGAGVLVTVWNAKR